jgi:hypothetical protein
MKRFGLLAALLGFAACGNVTASSVEEDAGDGSGGAAAMMGDAGGSAAGGAMADAGTGGAQAANDAGTGGTATGTGGAGTGGIQGSGGMQGTGGAGSGGAQGTGGAPVATYRTCMAVNGWEPDAARNQICVNNEGNVLYLGGLSGARCLTCIPTPFILHSEECSIPMGLCVKACSECAAP